VDGEESPEQRINREFMELLNELRVVLPGVQLLFGFMLTVPFSAGWDKATGFQRGLFFAVLCAVVISLSCLVAPAAYHRMRFRDGAKERNLRVANGFIKAGLLFLGFSLTGALVVIADFQFGTAAAILSAVFGLTLVAWAWWLMPLSDRAREKAGTLRPPSTPAAGD
jgi:Ca2+/Na+ antiporter